MDRATIVTWLAGIFGILGLAAVVILVTFVRNFWNPPSNRTRLD